MPITKISVHCYGILLLVENLFDSCNNSLHLFFFQAPDFIENQVPGTGEQFIRPDVTWFT